MALHRKPHLHTYLDRDNIFDIYRLWNDGADENRLLQIYGFSIQSLNRILNVNKWTKSQKKAWGKGKPPTLTRARYYTPQPFEKIQTKTSGVPGEGSKFTAPPADPSDFVDTDKNTTPEPATKVRGFGNIFKPLPELEQQSQKNTSPEAALENRLNQHEIETRIEAVHICFSMLQEEFAKLKILLRK